LKYQEEYNSENIKESEFDRRRLFNIVLGALLLRLLVLTFILTIGTYFADPYYITDDRNYELLAQQYMFQANNVIDIKALKWIGALGYLEVFWPIVMCVSAKMFHFLYAGRVINCLLSTACVKMIFDLTYEITEDEQASIKAAKLIAYLPICVLVCCFPIKDIFLMYAVLRIFLLIVKWHDSKPINIKSIIWCIVLLFCINRTRGGIFEFILISLCMFMLHKFYANEQKGLLIAGGLLSIIAIALLGNAITNSFFTKVDKYAGIVESGNLIKLIQMRHPWEIYKLPFSYLYATLQPMLLNYFTIGNQSIWVFIMGLLNISMYPVAIGNYCYIFMKKYNSILWIASSALMAGISALSLGNSRHYLFLMPFTILNFSLASNEGEKLYRQVVSFGSVGLFLLILFLSIIG
jgi:hypothetical protein